MAKFVGSEKERGTRVAGNGAPRIKAHPPVRKIALWHLTREDAHDTEVAFVFANALKSSAHGRFGPFQDLEELGAVEKQNPGDIFTHIVEPRNLKNFTRLRRQKIRLRRTDVTKLKAVVLQPNVRHGAHLLPLRWPGCPEAIY